MDQEQTSTLLIEALGEIDKSPAGHRRECDVGPSTFKEPPGILCLQPAVAPYSSDHLGTSTHGHEGSLVMRMGLCTSQTQTLPVPSVAAASASASNISCDKMAGPEEFACGRTPLQQRRLSNGVRVGQEAMGPTRCLKELTGQLCPTDHNFSREALGRRTWLGL